MCELSERDTEILEILVGLSGGDADWFFEIPVGAERIPSPPWPGSIQSPYRDEIRSLVNQDLLEIDRSVAPTWRFWPSAKAREHFPDAGERALKEALSDPDERLAVILKAIVDAFEADPSEPLLLLRTSSVDLVRHSSWAIPPDVVRHHDLSQLQELGLVGWESDTAFYPTPAGRTAVKNPAALLSERAEQTQDEAERSRLRIWVEKIRAGEIAVSATSGVAVAAIRALLGF
ncbi:MAG: hypothetical protein JSS68_14245 [Actinobacteria bacterium]|nr:hypothetical protein [Actinomycetota bacterium]